MSSAAPDRLRFLIYARSYCHLCDDMRQALIATCGVPPDAIQMVDVDADPALLADYDELVPVLMGVMPEGETTRLCHYFLDRDAVMAWLGRHA